MQPFVKDAPVELIYVADYSRMGKGAEEGKNLYSAADTALSARMPICFALPKDWQRWCAERLKGGSGKGNAIAA